MRRNSVRAVRPVEWIEVPSGDTTDPAKRVTALREAVAMLASRIGDAIAAAATPDARRR